MALTVHCLMSSEVTNMTLSEPIESKVEMAYGRDSYNRAVKEDDKKRQSKLTANIPIAKLAEILSSPLVVSV